MTISCEDVTGLVAQLKHKENLITWKKSHAHKGHNYKYFFYKLKVY